MQVCTSASLHLQHMGRAACAVPDSICQHAEARRFITACGVENTSLQRAQRLDPSRSCLHPAGTHAHTRQAIRAKGCAITIHQQTLLW